MIEWTSFTWEAFATLATGLFAAVAATVIGFGQLRIGRVQADIQREQSAISHRQTALIERQTHLAEIDQRIALFDRRLEIYAAFNNYLLDLIREGAPPDTEKHRDLVSALLKSRFLFRRDVYARLDDFETRASRFGFLKRKMKRDFDAVGYYEHGDVDRDLEAMTWFTDTFRGLADMFGDELKLSLAETEMVSPTISPDVQDGRDAGSTA